jgi:prolyl oligopeptidase
MFADAGKVEELEAMKCRVERIGSPIGFLLLGALLVLAPQALASIPSAPPMAPVRPIADTYFGTTIIDPYRYMENLGDPEVQAWMRAQNDYARRVLESIPGRAKLLARIKRLDESEPAEVSDIRRLPNGRIFYLRRSSTAEVAKLYMRDGLEGKERMLVDPSKYDIPGRPHVSISFYFVSQDGRYVTVGGSAPGGYVSARVFDTTSGKDTGETIDRVDFGIGFVPSVWLPDNHSFLYTKLRAIPPGSPLSEVLQKATVYRHVVGTDQVQDRPVFGQGVSPLVKISPVQVPTVVVQPATPYALGLVTTSGGRNDIAVYVAPLSAIGKPGTPWTKVCDVQDGVTKVAIHGDDLFLLGHKNAPHFQVVQTSISKPDFRAAQLVVPESRAVIRNMATADDALYLEELEGGLGRLLRYHYDSRTLKPIKLPFDGTVSLGGQAWPASPVSDPRMSGVLLRMGNWIRGDQVFAYDPATRQIANTGLQPLGPYDDPKDLRSKELLVKSFDGTDVPLSIVYRKGIKLNGSNPARLGGYGAFGAVFPPTFYRWQLAWLERGGILAWAHVRGGGEYGEEWHRAGLKNNKLNTVRDFLACAHYLIDAKYTSSSKLAGYGASAGGILIGRAITIAPRLFAAALDQVGVSDLLRKQTGPNGPITALEYGSTDTKEGFEGLLAMSPYNHVVDNTPYPAVLLMTAINDRNVPPWQLAKFAARLQAATSSGKPVLLRIDYLGGHVVGETRMEMESLLADEWSFLLWQFAEPGFQISAASAASRRND